MSYNLKYPLRTFLASMILFIIGFAMFGFTDSTMSKSSYTIKQINAGVLNIGYIDEGNAVAPVVILLHGWPYDIHSFDSVTSILVAKGYRVIVPYQRGYGSTTFLSEKNFRNGQQSAFAVDAVALMDALIIKKAIIAGFDWGARTACIMAALWPERCNALVSVSGYLIGNQQSGAMPLTPQAEQLWWYQFYFATERGRAGYEKYKNEFAKLIWENASPTWKFTKETFDRTASSLTNPDHSAIVIHNYRWRMGIEKGEPQYDALETQLAKGPFITVPAITIEGDANGAPHPQASAYVNKFIGPYSHKVFKGIGHNPPQESPRAFADAIIELGNQIKN